MQGNSLFSLNLSYWLLQAAAMLITSWLIPRLRITSFFGALTTVIALAFINSKVWDAALFFHIPDSFTMQALLLFLTNGIIFWVLVKILPGIEVQGLLPALLAPVVFTVCSILISKYAPLINWTKLFDMLIDLFKYLKSYFQHNMPGKTPAASP